MGNWDKLPEKSRIRFLSEAETKRLLAVCKQSKNQYLFAIVLLAISTGARRAELQFLEWQHVNSDATRITLPKTKNNEVRAVFIQGPAGAVIKQMRSTKGESRYLFPSPNDPNRPIDFESAWSHAVFEAKLENFRFHDLRHTCGSYLAMNGASAIEIAEVLGHKGTAMARRYSHLTESHTAMVVAKMNERMLGDVA